MKILIDLQPAQGESRFHGIGRYSLKIAEELVKIKKDDVYVLLSDAFPKEAVEIKEKLGLPEENYVVFSPLKPTAFIHSPEKWRVEVSEMIREFAIARVEPDVVFVPSVFEGFVDNIPISIKKFRNANTAVVLYDLIPLIYAQVYLRDKKMRQWYYYRLNHFRAADAFVAISESSKREGIEHLNLKEEDFCIAYPAPSEFFRVLDESDEQVLEKYGISKKYLLYVPSGYDFRKNVEALILAFGRLPKEIKSELQLVIASKIDEYNERRLKELARKVEANVVLTGYVKDEDLVTLYNLCELFVHPSLHEGFGLPIVEAMACGAPVIGSNSSSIAEIIQRSDALFDPRDIDSISNKILEVLKDDELREELKRYGLKRAKDFSWRESAKNVLKLFDKKFGNGRPVAHLFRKPRMAYLSPLPPAQSGISYYSSEILPELSKYYEIELIVNQKDVSDEYITANFPIRTVEYFTKNFRKYERVLYHMGNSEFHAHMWEVLESYPGVVVLHDFFLSNFLWWASQERRGVLERELFFSHGFKGLIDLKENVEKVVWDYPMNLRILQNAIGIIVHSEHSLELAKEFYEIEDEKFSVIPHMRKVGKVRDKKVAKRELGYDSETFLICSFGIVGKTKMTELIVDAFLSSSLPEKNCVLVIVGKTFDDEYGIRVLEKAKSSGGKVRVTGWVDEETWRKYLEACDLAVQLRTLSRGEVSGAVLDCLAFGSPTITNAHGFIKYLPNEVVYKLSENPSKEELREVLERLYEDSSLRENLSKNARKYVEENLNPREIAKKFYDAIERFYSRVNDSEIVERVSQIEIPREDKFFEEVSIHLDRTFPPSPRQRKILVDVSEIVKVDYHTGIQRVVKSILNELLFIAPKKIRVEPVYFDENAGNYRYARKWISRMLNLDHSFLDDELVDFRKGDVLLLIEVYPHQSPRKKSTYWELKALGVKIVSVVYDILPLKRPEWFGVETTKWFQEYIETLAEISDKIICISESTARDLLEYLEENGLLRENLKITSVHLGVEINRFGTTGLPEKWHDYIKTFQSKPTFLMVGTIEPRKGYRQALGAFEILWKEGYDLNLVIVGKEGWMTQDIIERIKTHPELNRRLFWINNASDEFLDKIYRACTALIMASEDEGFGLPIVEAAYRGLPIIARDIRVFREIARNGAYYFSGLRPEDLADAIKSWMELYRRGEHPKPEKVEVLSWREVAGRYLREILEVIS